MEKSILSEKCMSQCVAFKSYTEVNTAQSQIWYCHLLVFISQVKHNVGITILHKCRQTLDTNPYTFPFLNATNLAVLYIMYSMHYKSSCPYSLYGQPDW